MLTGERNHDAIAVKKREDEIPRWPNPGKAEAVRWGDSSSRKKTIFIFL